VKTHYAKRHPANVEEVDMAEIKVSGEAAVMNDVAQQIGEWAKEKGFEEDFEDAGYLAQLADVIESDLIEDPHLIAENLRRIAEAHHRLAVVQKLMLIVSECSESLEGLRDGGNINEELADIVIRAFHTSQIVRSPVGDEIVKKMDYNNGREYLHNRKF
jgi:NTP pyrophosphatase (non-canonical NTP hydrolase)